MGHWQRWVRQPQSLWIRKAIFQIHLWTGLAMGLYVVLLSATGSALVYRVEMSQAFLGPTPAFDQSRKQLSSDELRAMAERAYPGWKVKRVNVRLTRRSPTAVIMVEQAGETKERRFDPYTGADLGDTFPTGIRALNWLAELHDDLLFGRPGRVVNGILSAVVTVLALSGAIVWWPGVRNWRRSLMVKRKSSWIRFNWDLHSATGIWFCLVLVLWGVSGIYFAFPDPFTAIVDRFSDPELVQGTRTGDLVIEWMVRLHFGRFRNASYVQPLWVVGGLVPVAMAVTGVVMWWNRVLRKRLRQWSAVPQAEREVA